MLMNDLHWGLYAYWQKVGIWMRTVQNSHTLHVVNPDPSWIRKPVITSNPSPSNCQFLDSLPTALRSPIPCKCWLKTWVATKTWIATLSSANCKEWRALFTSLTKPQSNLTNMLLRLETGSEKKCIDEWSSGEYCFWHHKHCWRADQ